jgi:hypothetical protein
LTGSRGGRRVPPFEVETHPLTAFFIGLDHPSEIPKYSRAAFRSIPSNFSSDPAVSARSGISFSLASARAK